MGRKKRGKPWKHRATEATQTHPVYFYVIRCANRVLRLRFQEIFPVGTNIGRFPKDLAPEIVEAGPFSNEEEAITAESELRALIMVLMS